MFGELGHFTLNLFTVTSALEHVLLELCSVVPFGCPYPWSNLVDVAHRLGGLLNYPNCAFNGCFRRVG